MHDSAVCKYAGVGSIKSPAEQPCLLTCSTDLMTKTDTATVSLHALLHSEHEPVAEPTSCTCCPRRAPRCWMARLTFLTYSTKSVNSVAWRGVGRGQARVSTVRPSVSEASRWYLTEYIVSMPESQPVSEDDWRTATMVYSLGSLNCELSWIFTECGVL
ncbi:hypothetical protein BaRGS_00015761 [Batillaria attramentaria]|uniref:Uncharacterized protein n=1 Tax=Batillaria attramentaria TaxID=370345 RepID=A0ABD0L0H0_9CAEN